MKEIFETIARILLGAVVLFVGGFLASDDTKHFPWIIAATFTVFLAVLYAPFFRTILTKAESKSKQTGGFGRLRFFLGWCGLGMAFFLFLSLSLLFSRVLMTPSRGYHSENPFESPYWVLGAVGLTACGGICVGLIVLGIVKGRRDAQRLRDFENSQKPEAASMAKPIQPEGTSTQ